MRYLYATPLPEQKADTQTNQLRQQLAQQGLLDADGLAVEQIGLESDSTTLTGRWDYGQPLSKNAGLELHSLSRSNLGAVPLYSPNRELDAAGYYEVEGVTVDPVHANAEQAYTYNVSLSPVGTHESHFRAVRLEGSTNVCIDAQAVKTRWFSHADGLEQATSTDTVHTQFGSVNVFNPTNASFSPEYLLYELPFNREGRVDVTVWDPRNRPRHLKRSDSETLGDFNSFDEASFGRSVHANQWVHIFDTQFETAQTGEVVVENGLLRLRFTEEKGIIQAKQFENGRFVSVSLDHSDHLLEDYSIEQIDPARVDIELVFSERASADEQSCTLSLHRGKQAAFTTGNPPTMLDPIKSSESISFENAPRQTLIPRVETQ